ncbi:Hypp3601 [Branchiostoma lanceolatum]|uniref:Hypp3601 protein n=1 Tax=Branchiostoma lanceolatum TaxID=7740 RepID=A0A8K0A0E8_BRALA|nr:Hypp3601 [Branchiostoma lanceolatum]
MANLDRVWCSRRISPQTKIRLYNSLVLPILTYGGETWTLTAAQECRLDAFDTKCQRRILGIRWYDHISNDILRERSNQPPLSGKLRSARLRLLGHLIRAEPPLEPASLLKEPPPHPPGLGPEGGPDGLGPTKSTETCRQSATPSPLPLVTAQNRTAWRRVCRGATLPLGASGPE